MIQLFQTGKLRGATPLPDKAFKKLLEQISSLDKKKESARIIQSWLLANSPPKTLPDVEGVVRKFTEETEEQPVEGFDRRQLEVLEGL